MKNFKLLAIAGIFALALLLRLPSFGSLPVGLNRDEAALGYNAYSILKTGRDEFGVRFPVAFTSFGDQKLPGYIYTLVPLVGVLGPSAATIKLPSFLAGLAVIGLAGRLSWLLFEPKKTWRQLSPLPFLVMLLIAVSPWGNHFSRVAYEAHLALAFFLFGLVACLEGLRRSRWERWWLLASALGFSAALLTYHAYHILVPLTLLGLVVLNRKVLARLDRPGLLGALAVGALTVSLMFWGGVWGANQTKLAGINPFSWETVAPQFVAYRQAIPGNTLADKLLANAWTQRLSIFAGNLVEALSADFLFTTTTSHRVHNQSGIGNLHLFLAPFLLLGLAALWVRRREPAAQMLALWLLASLVAPSLTIAPQHTVRISPIFPALEIVAALGLLTAWQEISSRQGRRLFLLLVATVAGFSLLRYQINYQVLAPQRDRQFSHEKWELLARSLVQYRPQADRLITQSPSSSPYVWYLLAGPSDPAKLDIERYPADKEGFRHVRRVDNIYFIQIIWDEVYELAANQKLILLLQPNEVSDEQREQFTPLETIRDRYGETVWEVFALGGK